MKTSFPKTITKLICGTFFTLSIILMPHSSKAAGVTIITHGYDGDVTGWIEAMADEIPAYFYDYRYSGLSTNFSIYTMVLTYTNGFFYFRTTTNTPANLPPATDSGEIIIKLDWSQMAGSPDPLSSAIDLSTSNVAWAVSQVLMLTNAIPELNGHPLVEFPIHLIGHSRGGSLMSEVSRLLGTNGIWVDQLTTLDPHPLNNDGNDDYPVTTIDAPVHTYINVLFADNYWQDLGGGLFDPFDPDGEPVAGAYIRQLTYLAGGYSGTLSQYHSNVHLWYYGSIDLYVPTSYDDDGTIITFDATMRTNWYVPYEEEGPVSGFYYSLIGGGNRMSTEEPLGGPNDPEIVDGYNQWWDFGAGSSANRTPLTSNSGTWPNLIQFNVVGTNIVMAGQPIVTKFYYQYGGASNLVTAQFYFDRDLNPYNTNSALITQLSLPNTGVDSVYYDSANLATTNAPPGAYAIYGKISDGAHTRYLYAPEIVQIVSSTQPPVLGISEMNSSQFVIGVSGVVGQKIILQTSTDLQNWLPLMTNTLTSGAWFYTNNVSPNFSGQFYRAILNP